MTRSVLFLVIQTCTLVSGIRLSFNDGTTSLTASILPAPAQILPVEISPISTAGADPDLQAVIDAGVAEQDEAQYKVCESSS
jgi:hypothetical protein